MLRDSRLHKVACLLVVLLAVALAGCGGGSGSQSAVSRLPMIVDTDMSSDDLIAIAALARDDRVQLEAVSVSGTGLVHCPAGARLASELLSALGRGDVPVACGSDVPMQVIHALPEDWRTAADGMFGLELPAGRLAPRGGAVSLLRRAIDHSPRPRRSSSWRP